jgi:aryl-phospho-beta-D-glucosidase BglC (GH1 family)
MTLVKTISFFACLLFTSAVLALPAITTSGNKVLIGGKEQSLAGNSFFWSNNNYGGERYYNSATVSWLKSNWKSTIVRASMGVEDSGGYIDDAVSNRNRVITVVDAAIANDLYVIIDWHSHRAEDNQESAIAFFRDMARRYGDSNNVIFEIYNEPVSTTWPQIKVYANAVIKAIRDQGSDNLVVVGTPFYSQNVDIASESPITGFENIAYTLHFYAGTHGDNLRQKATTALRRGIPLFVTEWGSVNATGDGAVDVTETQRWMSFLRANNISHLNWAVNDKEEGASVVKPGANTAGNWPDSVLTVSGSLVRSIIRGWPQADLSEDEPMPPVVAPIVFLIQ